MRKYIVNLTETLIAKYRFDVVYKTQQRTWTSFEDFVKTVDLTLISNDVAKMSPEKLGMIVCSMEEHHLPAYEPAFFFGNPEKYLKNIVSSMLAWTIYYRIHAAETPIQGIPAYPNRNVVSKLLDELVKP